VFFTPLELVWECAENSDPESGYSWIASSLRYDQQTTPPSRRATPQEELTWFWQDQVTAYSYSKLTYKRDMLAAIGGLAKRMQPLFGCDYFAGIWRDCFIPNLLWKRDYSISSYDKRRMPDERHSTGAPCGHGLAATLQSPSRKARLWKSSAQSRMSSAVEYLATQWSK
jgi:hypothetical protein